MSKRFIYFFTVRDSDKSNVDYILDCMGVIYESAISGHLRKYYVTAEPKQLEAVYEAVKFRIV